MNRCQFSQRARLDLLEIFEHIANDRPRAAARLVDRLERMCSDLAASPQLGQKCEELAPSMRFFTLEKYVIYYRPIDDGIEVVRVVSGYRDVDSLFSPST